MYKNELGKLYFSPSDLTRFFESEFVSWMDRYQKFHSKDGSLAGVHRNPKDPLEELLATKGLKHEDAVCTPLRKNGSFVEISRNGTREAQLEETLRTMQKGPAVIYQAALQNHELFGYADLLERRKGTSKLGDFYYAPVDMKISSSPKPTAIIQLCAYADMLLTMQGVLPEHIAVVTRDEERHSFRTDSFFFFYCYFKRKFLDYQQHFSKDEQPLPEKGDDHRDWSIYAKKILHERDDVALTARVRQSHVQLLQKAGITTLTGLSKSKKQVEGISDDVMEMLVNQARLQVQSKGKRPPLYTVNPHPKDVRKGFAMLPDPHPKDIFFDMEGYPLLGKHGLEYLYGVSERGKRNYTEFWAYTPEVEGQTFKRFMEWVFKRWTENPGMHIYHYAPYEPSTLKRLMGTYGICERMMADLLRHEVFVDLYAVVVQGLQVGTYSYGLKAIEALYYPERETDVSSGAESAVEFAKWMDSDDHKQPEKSEFLKRIREYNQDDCWSTRDLEAFLQKTKKQHAIEYVPMQDKVIDEEEDASKPKAQCSRLAEELFSTIPMEKRSLPLEQTDEEIYAAELLAHCLDFHRREDSPEWWDYYRRRDMSREQLTSDSDTIVGVQIDKTSGDQLICRFPIDQDTKLRRDNEVLILENHDPFEHLKIVALDIVRGELTLSGDPTKPPPKVFTLAPARNYIRKDALQKSLLKQGNGFNSKRKYFGLRKAVYDLLLRKRPDIAGHKAGKSLLSGKNEPLEEITSTVLRMNESVLCIQGPPGTGKTFTGSHVIARLLKEGKRVAISSNSHKAINHLLLKVNDLCHGDRGVCRPLKVTSSNNRDSEEQEFAAQNVRLEESSKADKLLSSFNLVGATVFFLSKEKQEDQFDYLFVDEATQVALPNLLAMAPCARNIVLLGDQMQLEQPTKAVHPGDSGRSALVHVTNGNPVVAPDFGFFLPISYRMHPNVCQIVSDSFYEGALLSAPETTRQRIVWGKTPANFQQTGVQFVPVPHQGNKHGSIEEVDQIESIFKAALKSDWIDQEGKCKKLGTQDIVIVAPYNYQVALLQERLGPEARVGSVDIFQGQEAPLVILSLCASSGREAPRGLSFLLNKNRVNVAISRAKCVALVIGCPELWESRASSLTTMELLNTICRIKDLSTSIGRGLTPQPLEIPVRRATVTKKRQGSR